jgi:hypothetical protein
VRKPQVVPYMEPHQDLQVSFESVGEDAELITPPAETLFRISASMAQSIGMIVDVPFPGPWLLQAHTACYCLTVTNRARYTYICNAKGLVPSAC